MYCDESIISVYIGQPNYDRSGAYFFDYYYDMAIHLSDSHRLILETDHYFICLQADGVFKYEKNGTVESIQCGGEWIDCCYKEDEDPECAPWVEYEYTLLVGEKIITVETYGDYYSIEFSDFKINVYNYKNEDDVFGFMPAPYTKLRGTERLIKKCLCGGDGVLVVDFVSDYGIRCNKCHKGTSAHMCACAAIDEWNEVGDLDDIGLYPGEKFYQADKSVISIIAIDKMGRYEKDTYLECNCIILHVGNLIFAVKSAYGGDGKYIFSYNELGDYNHDIYEKYIESSSNEVISYGSRGFIDNNECMHLLVGRKRLDIVACKQGLKIYDKE